MDERMLNGHATILWNKFKPYLDKIFDREDISTEELHEANLIIYNGLERHSLRIGTQIYKTIYWYLAIQCSDIALQAVGSNTDNILAFYWKEWNNYKWSSKRLQVACSYLGFSWVELHHHFIRLKVYDIGQLPLILWTRMVYNLLPYKLTDLLINQIRQERLGNTIDRQLVSDLISTYVELGMEEVEGKVHKKESMNFYFVEFLIPFLRDTRDFYEKERAEFLEKNNLAGFEEKMVQREIEEKERSQKMLPEESLNKILGILKRVKNQEE